MTIILKHAVMILRHFNGKKLDRWTMGRRYRKRNIRGDQPSSGQVMATARPSTAQDVAAVAASKYTLRSGRASRFESVQRSFIIFETSCTTTSKS